MEEGTHVEHDLGHHVGGITPVVLEDSLRDKGELSGRVGGVAPARVRRLVGGGLLPGELLVVLVDLALDGLELVGLLPEAVPVLLGGGASAGSDDFEDCSGAHQGMVGKDNQLRTHCTRPGCPWDRTEGRSGRRNSR